MAEPQKVVILGAGVGGLAAAWALSARGFSVTLVEKTERLGGLAVTLERNGTRYDLGPHNIHTRHGHILSFFQKRFPSLFRHEPKFKIHKRGAWLDYPIRGLGVLWNLPLTRMPAAVLSFLRARLTMFAGEPRQDASFEDWICNRFGTVLYREYFHDYPAKVWQIPPSSIDRVVGDKRIPVFGFVELIRSAVLGRPARVDHPEVTSHNYYLKMGIGELSEFLVRENARQGVLVLSGTIPLRIESEEQRIRRITVRDESGRETVLPCDYLLSTIPLPELVSLLAAPDEPAHAAAASLDYCAAVLLFLRVSRRRPLPATMIYFSEPGILFSRVSDMGEFSYDMVRPEETLLCLEIPCNVGDATWASSLENLADHAAEVLEQKGLLKRSEILESFTEHITHSYPRFRVGYERHLDACIERVGRHPNLLSYGRQGGFAYINTDTVLHQGFLAAGAVLFAEHLGFTLLEWFGSQQRGQ